MTQKTSNLVGLNFTTGMLYAELVMIRKDLYMGESRAAIEKVNDALRLIEEKTAEVLYEHEKKSLE